MSAPSTLPGFETMPLAVLREPFDHHPDWIFEPAP
jgi:hypothetical protein